MEMRFIALLLFLCSNAIAVNISFDTMNTGQFQSNSLKVFIKAGAQFTNPFIAGIITNQNLATNLFPFTNYPTIGRGQILNYNGTNAAWGTWAWIVDEHFLGDGTTAGRVGREAWATSDANGGQQPAKVGEIGALGIFENVVTNAADRAAIVITAVTSTIIPTNTEMYFECRVRLNSTNNATDGAQTAVGLNNTSTFPGARGMFFGSSNNIWMLYTGDANTFQTNSHPTLGQASNNWQTLAFYYDGITNVIGYIGSSYTNLTPFATNTQNITTNTLVPVFSMNKFLGATARHTNDLDYYRLAIKLP